MRKLINKEVRLLEGNDILNRLADAGLVPPKAVTLSITNRCNQNCRHCWPDSGPGDKTPLVPKKVLLRLIRESAALGVEKLILTGGESLIHPDWFDILVFACQQQGIKEVCFQTNAVLLTKAEVNALLSMADGGLSIQVSLEGASAENHDYVRGRGSFDLTVQGLKRLVQAGLGPKTCVAFTEMRHNCEDIPQALELTEQLGLGRFVTGALVTVGRAQTSQLALPVPEQYRDLLNRYHTDKRFRERYAKLANIAAIEWFKGQAAHSDRVCTCIENLFITANGVLYPCTMLPYDKYAISNVHSRPLQEAISDGLSLWTELPNISRLRSTSLKACKQCSGRKHCAGGCMGRAYAAFGNLMAVEDRCLLRKAVYGWEASNLSLHLIHSDRLSANL